MKQCRFLSLIMEDAGQSPQSLATARPFWGACLTGWPDLSLLWLDAAVQSHETDFQAEWGIQGLKVGRDDAGALAPLYRVARNDRSWFKIKTTDDLSVTWAGG